MAVIQSTQDLIYESSIERARLDFDFAVFYEVATEPVNEAVKGNVKRFSTDFIFRMTLSEWQVRRAQTVAASQVKRNTSVTRYAVTEQGVAMLSGIRNTGKAIYDAIENLLYEKAAKRKWNEKAESGLT